MCNPLFNQTLFTVQTKREGLMLVAPNTPTGKRMKCSAARKDRDIKRNVPTLVMVANVSRETKMDSKVRSLQWPRKQQRGLWPQKGPQGKC